MIETLYGQLVGSVNSTSISIDQCEINVYRYLCDAIIIDAKDNNGTAIKIALDQNDAKKLIDKLSNIIKNAD